MHEGSIAEDTAPKGSSPGRRGAIAVMGGFVAALCAGFGLPALAYLLSPPRRTSGPEWVDVGGVDDFEPNVPRAVAFLRTRTDGWKREDRRERAWVVKNAGGELAAFSPFCTHLGCAYGWDGERGEFVCPCHDSRFGSDGQLKAGPAPRGLDRYEVRISGRRLWLRAAGREAAGA